MKNVLRRMLIGIGAAAVVAMGVELAAPRRVRAVVSALVTVANTTSNPVPTIDATKSPSQIVELHAYAFGGYSTIFTSVSPDGTVSPNRYEVPAGQILVITDVDVMASGAVTGQFDESSLEESTGGPRRTSWITIGPATQHYSYRSGLAIAPGIELSLVNEFSTDPVAFVILHGYLTPAS